MKFNRILSTVIIFVMLFTSIIAVFPVGALAEESGSGVTVTMIDDSDIITDEAAVKDIAKSALAYKFSTAEEMLNYELEKGYLVSAATQNYTLYVNIYTGFVYYKNNVTGQILTSNPTDPGTIVDQKIKQKLMSQIELTFTNKTDNSADVFFTSMQWIESGSFISVSSISNKGISVSYTLGEANTNFIAPSAVLYESFIENIANVIFDNFAALLEDACGKIDTDKVKAVLDDLNKTTYSNHKPFTTYDVMDNEAAYSNGVIRVTNVQSIVTAMSSYVDVVVTDTAKKEAIADYAASISSIFTGYDVVNKSKYPANLAPLPAVEEGKTVFLMLNADTLLSKQVISKAFRNLLPEYSFEDVKAHEEECGYITNEIITPTFNCEINYILDNEGNLTVDVPVSPDVLVFRNDHYSLTSITPLKYFGAGNMDNDGYIFYPDGSGTIVEFSDFYYGTNSGKSNPNIGVEAAVYGQDYIYSEITGAHREQISMPVYGIANDVTPGASAAEFAADDKITNGFFMIVEEGSAIASLGFVTEGNMHKYASAYAKFKPYPSDKIDLSETISVSANNFYYKIAETGYQGSCRFKINMLSDETVAAKSGFASNKGYYPADYSGMAACYRDYLTDKGELTALSDSVKDLPLYIEALGSIDVTQRILTFPVTVSTPLTTFKDVENIYKALSDVTAAKKAFTENAEKYRQLAKEKEEEGSLNENEEILIAEYRAKAQRYDELAENVGNILNINFRLTGFANGGMYFTYPARVSWESSVGGKSGFNDLISYSKEVSAKAGSNLGIYPDFDFLFINNTALFDGINPDGTAARMIDNRYASKQVYNSIQQEYESLFALVISTDSLGELYSKFNREYSKFDIKSLSVSTLGSVLNSNMDEDNTINREDALGDVSELLATMNKADGDNNYSLMTDIGNMYSVKYVDHILNASIDSSHFRFSSFAVPFYGMVLHGSVSYAGSPINYSGSPDYDILRSIESGASLYYIVCCSNTNYLKEDKLLSGYYGIDYVNWEEKILEQYAVINNAIGDLQKYNITSHDILTVERIIDSDELLTNYTRLADELVVAIGNAISAEIDRVVKVTKEELGNTAGKGFVVKIDSEGMASLVADLFAEFAAETERAGIEDDVAELSAKTVEEINKIIANYNDLYSEEKFPEGKEIAIGKGNVKYTSKYSYDNGDSVSTDRDNYKYTDFTCDNGSVVMVTYSYTDAEGKTDEVVFILNYNNFSVDVTLDGTVLEGVKSYTLGEYGCYRISSTGAVKIK